MLKKIILSFLSGYILSILTGIIILPILRKLKVNQNVSNKLNQRHLLKKGTPTMGGFIFILSTLFIMIFLLVTKKINYSYNIITILFVFVSYAILGFLDDFLKIKFHNNKGLSIILKFSLELIICIIFFFLYLKNGNTILDLYFFKINLKFLYGFLILFMVTGSANAVNITDGLDGLASGLMIISLISFAIISLNSPYIIGYEEITIFSIILSGSLLGFLVFNFYPAKVFMGDLGSLSLGGVLAAIAIVLKSEIALAFIGIVYIIETLSSFIQIISIRYFHKKIFLKSPLHHHFEMLNYKETEIIKIFYFIAIFFSLITLIIIAMH